MPLSAIKAAEIIVAAAGDPERTTRAGGGRARLLCCGDATRAGLLNAGAAPPSAEILFFLHADSLPP